MRIGCFIWFLGYDGGLKSALKPVNTSQSRYRFSIVVSDTSSSAAAEVVEYPEIEGLTCMRFPSGRISEIWNGYLLQAVCGVERSGGGFA